jgi:hypothetical protein
MAEPTLRRLVDDARLNAVLAWVLVVVVALAAVGNLLQAEPLSAGFAIAVVALAVLPPLSFRDWVVMLPWEVLVLASLPVLGRTFVVLSGIGTGRIATYVAVAAIALIVAVELHVFTPVRMDHRFAVAFVVLTTMAAAGVWAVLRWVPDVLLGTTFLLTPGVEEEVVERRLMLDFVASTVAGVAAGVVFVLYFRRARIADRIDDLDLDVDLDLEEESA